MCQWDWFELLIFPTSILISDLTFPDFWLCWSCLILNVTDVVLAVSFMRAYSLNIFNPKKKLVGGAPLHVKRAETPLSTSFFLGLKCFISAFHLIYHCLTTSTISHMTWLMSDISHESHILLWIAISILLQKPSGNFR